MSYFNIRCGRQTIALQAARGCASKPQLPGVAVSFPLPCSVFAPVGSLKLPAVWFDRLTNQRALSGLGAQSIFKIY